LEIIELLCYLLLMSLFSVVLATFWSVCDDWCCRFMIMINVWEQIFFLWQCRKKERDIKSNNCACERVRIFRRVLVERNTETIRSNGKRNKNVLLWKKDVDVKWKRKRTFFATAWYKKVSTSYTSLFAQAGIHRLQDNRSSFLTLELKGRQRSRFVSNHYSQRKKGKTFVNVNCRQKVFLGKNNHQSFST
jgi:hypothetical protein